MSKVYFIVLAIVVVIAIFIFLNKKELFKSNSSSDDESAKKKQQSKKAAKGDRGDSDSDGDDIERSQSKDMVPFETIKAIYPIAKRYYASGVDYKTVHNGTRGVISNTQHIQLSQLMTESGDILFSDFRAIMESQ